MPMSFKKCWEITKDKASQIIHNFFTPALSLLFLTKLLSPLTISFQSLLKVLGPLVYEKQCTLIYANTNEGIDCYFKK